MPPSFVAVKRVGRSVAKVTVENVEARDGCGGSPLHVLNRSRNSPSVETSLRTMSIAFKGLRWKIRLFWRADSRFSCSFLRGVRGTGIGSTQLEESKYMGRG